MGIKKKCLLAVSYVASLYSAAAQTGPLDPPGSGDGPPSAPDLPDSPEFVLNLWYDFLAIIIQGQSASTIQQSPIPPTIFFALSFIGFYLLVETADDALGGLFSNSNIPGLTYILALSLGLLAVSQSGYVGIMEGVYTAFLLGSGIVAVGVAVAFLIMGPGAALGAIGAATGLSAGAINRSANFTKDQFNALQVKQLQDAGNWLGDKTIGNIPGLKRAWNAWTNIPRCDGDPAYGGVKHLNPGGGSPPGAADNCTYDGGSCNGTVP